MHVLQRVEDYQAEKKSAVLTIGNFDGIHRGHQTVLKSTLSLIQPGGKSVVITFSNHPSELLKPELPPILRLCTPDHKLKLMEEFGIHTLITIPFTRWLAQHSAAQFIEHVRQSIPFTHLVLGHDATLGRDRQGKPVVIKELGEEWGFEVHYQPEFRYEGHPISSTTIRNLLQEGNLEQVENLLGRPFSIYSTIIHGEERGKQLGFPTANIDVKGLCLPPYGVYAVEAEIDGIRHKGIANLGVAPTLNEAREPLLEVHLFDFNHDIYTLPIEVIFKSFIRPEKKFESSEQLAAQIKADTEIAKQTGVTIQTSE